MGLLALPHWLTGVMEHLGSWFFCLGKFGARGKWVGVPPGGFAGKSSAASILPLSKSNPTA